jgi:hypothetical protein
MTGKYSNHSSSAIVEINFKLKIILAVFLFITIMDSVCLDFSKGPLYGKNFFVPYLIYYNFPGFRADIKHPKTLSFYTSVYYTNDFLLLDEKTVLTDYESCVVENGFSYSVSRRLEVGAALRLYSYYGGFLDDVITAFHHVFLSGYPQYWLGRDDFPEGRVNVDIPDENGVPLKLTGASFSLGDIDTFIKYNFFNRKYFSFSVAGAFKIPTGRLGYLSGSEFPDFGFQILADFMPIKFISFYIQAGIVVPFDSLFRFFGTKPFPMFNGLVCVEINPVKCFSILYQLNIKTSPIISKPINTPKLSKYKYLLSAPQVNTLVGIKFEFFENIIQIYIEENTFTNAGADVTFNIEYAHFIFVR